MPSQSNNSSNPFGKYLKGRCLFLLVALLALLLVPPFLPNGPIATTMVLILNSGTLVAGIYAVSEGRRSTVIALVIAVLWFGLTWTDYVVGDDTSGSLSLLLTIMFYTFALVRVLAYVVRDSPVTLDKIYGAASVYLLMGVAWASGYALVYAAHPASFYIDPARIPAGVLSFNDLLHFSFVTLTTLGYGDITPISAPAKSLASVEAVCGVLYIAILVARLVASYRSENDAEQEA